MLRGKKKKPPTPTLLQLGEQLLFFDVPARLKAPKLKSSVV